MISLYLNHDFQGSGEQWGHDQIYPDYAPRNIVSHPRAPASSSPCSVLHSTKGSCVLRQRCSRAADAAPAAPEGLQCRQTWLEDPWRNEGFNLFICSYIYIYTWLVVSIPLKNISQWEGLSHILWKIKNVWNHQPDTYVLLCVSVFSLCHGPFLNSANSFCQKTVRWRISP